MRHNWTLQWDTRVVCTDAPPYGYGACEATWSRDDVQAAGQVEERGRFRLASSRAGTGARSRFFRFNSETLGQGELSQVLAGETEASWRWETDEGFPEIPAEQLRREHFMPTCWGRFVRDEDIMVLERVGLC